jgi:hypothetical protein
VRGEVQKSMELQNTCRSCKQTLLLMFWRLLHTYNAMRFAEVSVLAASPQFDMHETRNAFCAAVTASMMRLLKHATFDSDPPVSYNCYITQI